MSDDLLSVKNLSKRFEKQTVIENLSFRIPNIRLDQYLNNHITGIR